MKVANTPENNAKVKALKKINECKWVGSTVHSSIDRCLTAINLDSMNSGWYRPVGVRLAGLQGIFMLNEDGSIFCEAKVIMVSDDKYRIEYLSNSGWMDFEKYYFEFLENQPNKNINENKY